MYTFLTTVKLNEKPEGDEDVIESECYVTPSFGKKGFDSVNQADC